MDDAILALAHCRRRGGRAAYDRKRVAERRAELLGKCRALMAAGNFRPTGSLIAGISPHHIGNHFGSLEGLYTRAIEDPETKRAILKRVVRDKLNFLSPDDERRIIHVAVFGSMHI